MFQRSSNPPAVSPGNGQAAAPVRVTVDSHEDDRKRQTPLTSPAARELQTSIAAGLPAALLQHIFKFCALEDIVAAAATCRLWWDATVFRGLWNSLCERQNWPQLGKAWYMQKHHSIRLYGSGTVSTIMHEGSSGVSFLYAPVEKRVTNWTKGSIDVIDTNVLVSGGSAPRYGFTVWSTESMKQIRQFGTDGMLRPSAAHITDNVILLAQAVRQAELMLVDGGSVRSFGSGAHTSAITCVRMTVPRQWSSAAGREELVQRAVSGSYDCTVRVWDLRLLRQLRCLRGHTDKVWSVDIHPDGQLVASGAEAGDIRVWHVEEDEKSCIELQGHDHTVMVLRFDPHEPDTFLFSAGYDCTVKQWDYKAKQCIRTYQGHTDVVFTLEITPFVIISGSRDTHVRVWDRHTGECVRTLPGHTADIKCSALLPSRSHGFATGSYDGKIIVWRFGNLQAAAAAARLAEARLSAEQCVVM